jgi:1-deoxy-D-xylulose-5-phosphate synthase
MIPDTFLEQANVAEMCAEAGLDRAGIVATVLQTMGIEDVRAASTPR